jgi:hypothetical protein
MDDTGDGIEEVNAKVPHRMRFCIQSIQPHVRLSINRPIPLLLLGNCCVFFTPCNILETTFAILSIMPNDGPLLERYPSIALASYHHARRGLAYIYEGLMLVGKAIVHLLGVVLLLFALGLAYSENLLYCLVLFTAINLVNWPSRIVRRLVRWIRPNHPDTLPIFQPRRKTL